MTARNGSRVFRQIRYAFLGSIVTDARKKTRAPVLGSLVHGYGLETRLDGREFNSRPPRLIMGWVTVFGRANHLSISPSHPGRLSLLPSAGRKMSRPTSQSVMENCLIDPSLTRAIPERLEERHNKALYK